MWIGLWKRVKPKISTSKDGKSVVPSRIKNVFTYPTSARDAADHLANDAVWVPRARDGCGAVCTRHRYSST